GCAGRADRRPGRLLRLPFRVLRKGPAHVFANQLVGVVTARAQRRQDLRRRRRVAQRDGDVPQPAAVAAAADGGAFGTAQELFFGPGEQCGQAGLVEPVAGAEVRLVAAACELVPGTDQLAVVAAEDPVADRRAELFGDRAV